MRVLHSLSGNMKSMARKFSGRVRRISLPIIDEKGVIVAWTTKAPVLKGALLLHQEAERLVGPLDAVYVEIEDPELMRKAGAPNDWTEPWRCLGLCSVKLKTRAQGGILKHRMPEG